MEKLNRFSKSFKKGKMLRSMTTMSNGQFTDMSKTPKRHTTQKASGTLQDRGIMAETSENMTTNRIAIEMLSAIGYTVEVSQSSYTLMAEQTDDEKILNSSISDENLSSEIENENTTMEDKFISTCDPIYELDDNIPDNEITATNYLTQAEAETLDLVATGYMFGSGGMSKTKKNNTSRYFNNEEVSQALQSRKR